MQIPLQTPTLSKPGDAAAVGLVITLALSVAGIIFWASLSLKRTQRKDSTGEPFSFPSSLLVVNSVFVWGQKFKN